MSWLTLTSPLVSPASVFCRLLALTCAFCAPASAWAAYRDAVLSTPGLVHYWRLEETSGIGAADEKGTNPGIYSNGPALDQPGAITGPASRAVSFDGIDDGILLEPAPFGTPASVTIELWAKVRTLKSNPGEHSLLSCAFDEFEDGIMLAILSDGRATSTFGNTGVDRVVSNSPVLALDTWVYLVATFDDAKDVAKLYVNGAEVAADPWIGTINYRPERGMRLGAQVKSLYRSIRFLDGWLDEVAIYGSALTAEQVSSHYRIGTDATAPETTLDSGAPVFGFSTNEPGSTFECRIDASGWQPCATGWTSPALPAGTHTFEVRAVDLAGNPDPTPASAQFEAVAAGALRVGCNCESGSGLGGALLAAAAMLKRRRARKSCW
jgi:hypothetical protein